MSLATAGTSSASCRRAEVRGGLNPVASIGSINSFMSAATSDLSARASMLMQLKTGGADGDGRRATRQIHTQVEPRSNITLLRERLPS